MSESSALDRFRAAARRALAAQKEHEAAAIEYRDAVKALSEAVTIEQGEPDAIVPLVAE